MVASVTPILVDSKRMCVVKVDCQDYSLLICNVYMPCVKGNSDVSQEYYDVLIDISAVCNNNPTQYIIVGSDFNTGQRWCEHKLYL